MRKAYPLQQELLGTCVKPASLQYFCGSGTLPHRKRGNLEELDPTCMMIPTGQALWESGGPVTHKDRNVTVNVGMDDVNELCITEI